MSDKAKLKKLPSLLTDEDAERAVDEEDLSEYDLSGFKPMHFEFQTKAAKINMRVPQGLLDAVKERARAHGMPYTRYIRQLMERDIARKS